MRILLLLTLFCCCLKSAAQRSALDSTFGLNGIVMVDSPHMMENNRVGVQADGKIVLAGTYYNYELPSFDLHYDLRIMRFLPNGRLDSSFNGTGIFSRPTLRSTRVAALNIQKDGKILVTGSRGLLERFLSSGIPDSSFNDSSRVILSYFGPYDYISGTALQQDGKIVVTGMLTQQYILVARFKPDGRPDSSFGYFGKLNTMVDSAYLVWGGSVAVQPDGKIIVVGGAREGAPNYYTRFLFVRYLPNGDLDPGFNNGKGNIKVGVPGLAFSSASSIQLLPDGRILAGGLGYNAAVNTVVNTRQCITRLNASGTVDYTFNGTGLAVLDSSSRPAAGKQWQQPCMKVQADGKVLLSTTSGGPEYDQYFSLLRIDTSGKPDYSFGDSGRVITQLTNNDDIPWDIALQADGKILLCGSADQDTAWPQSQHALPAIVRYLPNVNLVILPTDTTLQDMSLYPNPVRDALTLKYGLAKQENLSIQLCNVAGQQVQQWLKDDARSAGNHKEELALNGSIAPGTYVLSVRVGNEHRSFMIVRQ